MLSISETVLKKLIPEYKKAEDQKVRIKYGYLAAWVSIVGNTLMFAVKLFLGILINSISLIADSFHTLSDIVTSIVVLLGFRTSKMPADKKHPFGHGRAEPIATFSIAILLVIVGIEFLKSSVERFIQVPLVKGSYAVALALLLSAILKELMALFSIELGKRISSSTLIADAWHHRSDAIASALVAIAIVAARFGYNRIDAFFGILVSGLIVYTGYTIGRSSASSLIGEAVGERVLSKIRDYALRVKGVAGVHGVVVHNYGEYRVISLHVEVKSNVGLVNAHEIASAVEKEIEEGMRAAAVVHIDLQKESKIDTKIIEETLDRIVRANRKVIAYYGVDVTSREDGGMVDIHIVIDPELSVKESHELSHEISSAFTKSFKNYKVNVHVEPCIRDCTKCSEPCKRI